MKDARKTLSRAKLERTHRRLLRRAAQHALQRALQRIRTGTDTPPSKRG